MSHPGAGKAPGTDHEASLLGHLLPHSEGSGFRVQGSVLGIRPIRPIGPIGPRTARAEPSTLVTCD
jgi:hypothetical protein